VGKTYRKMSTDKFRSKKRQKRIWKKFQIRNELKEVVQDYENNEEMSELSDENFQANS